MHVSQEPALKYDFSVFKPKLGGNGGGGGGGGRGEGGGFMMNVTTDCLP